MNFSTWRHVAGRTTTISGVGAIDEVCKEVENLGLKRAFVVSSSSAGKSQAMALTKSNLTAEIVGVYDSVSPHPELQDIEEIVAQLERVNADVIIALGGASVADAAKGAALLHAGGKLEFNPEAIADQASAADPEPGLLPIIGIPGTYAGACHIPAGAYMQEGHKTYFSAVGLAHRFIAYDPRGFEDIPAGVLCTTGMNGLAHVLEAVYTPAVNPYVKTLAAGAAARFAKWLPARAKGDTSYPVLAGLADASILGVTAFAIGGAALHHSICHILGAKAGMSHGDANTAILPYVLKANERSSQEVQTEMAAAIEPELVRWGVPQGLGLPEQVKALQALIGKTDTLAALGVPRDDLKRLADEVIQRETGLAHNPRLVDAELVHRVLEAAWRGDLDFAAQ